MLDGVEQILGPVFVFSLDPGPEDRLDDVVGEVLDSIPKILPPLQELLEIFRHKTNLLIGADEYKLVLRERELGLVELGVDPVQFRGSAVADEVGVASREPLVEVGVDVLEVFDEVLLEDEWVILLHPRQIHPQLDGCLFWVVSKDKASDLLVRSHGEEGV